MHDMRLLIAATCPCIQISACCLSLFRTADREASARLLRELDALQRSGASCGRRVGCCYVVCMNKRRTGRQKSSTHSSSPRHPKLGTWAAVSPLELLMDGETDR